jgi:hypothetical protein
LRYYSRIRCINGLLPLLKAVPDTEPARVVSILAAGNEGPLIEDDLDLKKNYSVMNCMAQSASLTTLAFSHLAKKNPTISFIHTFPGIVLTGVYGNGMSQPYKFLMQYVVKPMLWPASTSIPESGERGLYYATSARYPPLKGFAGVKSPDDVKALGMDGGLGVGPYLVSATSDPTGKAQQLASFKEKSSEKLVWDHTLSLFEATCGN